jgi:hypothetical protein
LINGTKIHNVQGLSSNEAATVEGSDVAVVLNKMAEYEFVIVPGALFAFNNTRHGYDGLIVMEREK